MVVKIKSSDYNDQLKQKRRKKKKKITKLDYFQGE